MKKLLVVAIIIIVGGLLLQSHFEKKKEENIAADYEKIQQLEDACYKVAYSPLIFTLGSRQDTWYIFELEFIHQPENDVHEKLESLLGEDYVTKLSNGDKLFVGFLPYRQAYEIYAGKPSDEYMIYPDWNYTKLTPAE